MFLRGFYNGNTINEQEFVDLELSLPCTSQQPKVLIETMRLNRGQVGLWYYHKQRLWNSIILLGWDVSQYFQEMVDAVSLSLSKTNEDEYCRLLVFQGKEGLDYLLGFYSLPNIADSITVSTSQLKITYHHFYMLKTNCRTTYIDAKNQFPNVDDVFIQNEHGRIVETTKANLFWIINDKIFTPSVEEGGVQGVFKKYLIDLLQRENISIEEKPLTNEMFDKAEEFFVTNALRGIQPISKIDGKDLPIKKSYALKVLVHRHWDLLNGV